MKISKVQCTTFRLTAQCEEKNGKCSGVLEYTGRTLLTAPPQHVHECTVCGKKRHLSDVYPRFEHVPHGGV